MDTPICDFIRQYAESKPARFHMPGHKGRPILGCEPLDLTEIDGADNLYGARGIIAESEANAGRLFGCPTFYSAQGSSLAIQAMLYLAVTLRKPSGKRPVLLAGRNAHKTLIHTAALLDIDVRWLYPKAAETYQSCTVTPADAEAAIMQTEEQPCALFLTSPDYLGNVTDVSGVADVCRRYSVPLLVDNAHGAYLKFLSPSRHPIDQGADMCCDSAHKTLPVLTGGAYLHISPAASPLYAEKAREAMALFGSTSPSYLILQSLDRANVYLETYPETLSVLTKKTADLKEALAAYGYQLPGSEPMKLTVAAKNFGYTGNELAAFLKTANLICEYHDPDYMVCMLTPDNTEDEIKQLYTVLTSLPRRTPLDNCLPSYQIPRQVLSPRTACLSPSERLPAKKCEGRILASAAVSCPPAVPIVMCGEEIDKNAVALFKYYGIDSCSVVKNS